MSDVSDLLTYLDAGSSPYHAVAETTRRLEAADFQLLDLSAPWPNAPGRFMVTRGGSLMAWVVPPNAPPERPFRLVGAHTDSPGLRIKPDPDTGNAGWQQLAVEVYGGALWNSWLDRDLGLSGRVVVREAAGPTERLFRDDHPLLRIPQLAIHLDRDVNGSGLKLNPQQHLTPVWGVGPSDSGTFRAYLADQLTVSATEIMSWDLMVHDLTPAALIGRNQELVSSGRLDNLLSCWAATDALIGSGDPAPGGPVAVMSLFDHEEVGSTSATGANGALLAQVLERTVDARGGGRVEFLRALATSVCLSADGAHATHPNYAERHDPDHHVAIDGGPVIKVNANQRYATEPATAAIAVDACDRAGVPHQVFVGRNDQPCGSTIGPATAAQLGMATVDVGVAQLSMHSARELCGAADPVRMTAMLGEFFQS